MNPSYPSDSARAALNATAKATYSPSVPLSVYRELATELQATKAMVDSLGAQNQHLAQQNQQLRQEIHRVVQSTLQLGQYAGVAQQNNGQSNSGMTQPRNGKPLPSPESPARLTKMPLTPPAPQPQPESVSASMPISMPSMPSMSHPQPTPAPVEPKATPSSASHPLAVVPKFFTEQAGERKRYETETGQTREMSGLWLLLSITVIILTAFGAGFLIMRPLLSDR